MSEFSARIDKLLAANHLRRVDMCRATGIGDSTVRGWIKGQTPSVEAAYKVAQYFGVSLEYLVTGIEDGKPAPHVILTADEENLLDNFRIMTARDKHVTLAMAGILALTGVTKKSEKKGDCDL